MGGNAGGGGSKGSDKNTPPKDVDETKTDKDGNNTSLPRLILKLSSDTYTLNNKTYASEIKTFVSKSNRIMVSVRYITYALNIPLEKIQRDSKKQIVTIKGEKTIVLLIGKKVQLNEKTQVINGRVFLPIGDISRVFGIKYV